MSGKGEFGTAQRRWAGLGPYYAMFPLSFAEAVIKDYTAPGDCVLDPFAGRGTSIFAAGIQGRSGLGIEINPVGWIYAKTKLGPAKGELVLARLEELADSAAGEADHSHLPAFFRWCFSKQVLSFLLNCRATLDWRRNRTDRTLMALVLQDLHGNRGRALSNQMRQAKSLAPDYSVRWWRERGMRPPRLEVKEHLAAKIRWRYRHGLHQMHGCNVWLGDSSVRLSEARKLKTKPSLLFTSPPYIGVADYHYDQWLRLWMLDGDAQPMHPRDETCRGDFANPQHYRSMLLSVFARAADALASQATVYVRTDAREATLTATKEVLRDVFGNVKVRQAAKPFFGKTQTLLFGDLAPKPGEVDLIIKTRRLWCASRAVQHA